ncbi:hypothetical protein GCM10010995_07190 [Cysteiniphilum litorale]|uniref:Uncharacterized protein n=2 Tax=Fastidiosibacteraceae TaxID=2056687 RepID=A0A8J2Z3E2_9GAMM|nr:hypothetical protein GCM10010995_07190 [Cysteiniphilum litorale]
MNISFATNSEHLIAESSACICDTDRDLLFIDQDIELLAVRSNGYHYVGSLKQVLNSKQFELFSKDIKAMLMEELNQLAMVS